jgi:N6-L-threonylcarbamoyladenine synthase
MSGGKAIEHLAKQGNRFHFDISPPMQHAKNCDFSFSGLQHVIDKIITQKEKEEGIFFKNLNKFFISRERNVPT